MFYTVYKITNLVNDKIYIGVHKTTDLDDGYMGSGKLIKKAIEKYGIENFKKDYIKVFDNSEDMFNMESQLVNEEFVSRDDTYNLKEGGFGGFDYINKYIPFENRGFHYINKNNLNNLSNQCYITANKIKASKEYSEWFSARISDGLKKYFETHDNPFKGKTHTDETKKKIGEANSKHQTGKGNSQYGTMWIHSLTEKVSKKIKKDEFSTYEQQGWLKGRKMKFI